ncbi:MAG: alginate lyase family protein [Acidobacteriaceae bacterium]|nr:alginate lyase family protein [Acidobacteriaceae bacterium]
MNYDREKIRFILTEDFELSAARLVRSMTFLLGIISIAAGFLVPAYGFASTTPSNMATGYAIFSPDVIAKLPSLRATPVGAATLTKANAFLGTVPKPMPRLHVRHLNESTEFHDQSNLAQQDWEAMLYLGLAYRISGAKQYLDADVRYFGVWAEVFKPGFADLDPIDQAQTEQLMMAYDLVRDSLPAPIVTEMNTLCRSLAEGYMQWAAKSGQDGNLQSHAVELAMLAAYETNDPDIEKRAAKLFLKQISKAVQKDGSVTDWKARDALLYVDFNLKPLATGAYAGHVHGFEWFHTGGKRSLAHAVEWLIPYTDGRLQHREFIHTTLGFDHHRKEWGVTWKPSKSSQDILGLAALMDPAFEVPFQQCMQVATYPPGILVQVMSAIQP